MENTENDPNELWTPYDLEDAVRELPDELRLEIAKNLSMAELWNTTEDSPYTNALKKANDFTGYMTHRLLHHNDVESMNIYLRHLRKNNVSGTEQTQYTVKQDDKNVNNQKLFQFLASKLEPPQPDSIILTQSENSQGIAVRRQGAEENDTSLVRFHEMPDDEMRNIVTRRLRTEAEKNLDLVYAALIKYADQAPLNESIEAFRQITDSRFIQQVFSAVTNPQFAQRGYAGRPFLAPFAGILATEEIHPDQRRAGHALFTAIIEDEHTDAGQLATAAGGLWSVAQRSDSRPQLDTLTTQLSEIVAKKLTNADGIANAAGGFGAIAALTNAQGLNTIATQLKITLDHEQINADGLANIANAWWRLIERPETRPAILSTAFDSLKAIVGHKAHNAEARFQALNGFFELADRKKTDALVLDDIASQLRIVIEDPQTNSKLLTRVADVIWGIGRNRNLDAPGLKNAISLLQIIVEKATNPEVLRSAADAIEEIADNPKTDAPDLINAASLLKIIVEKSTNPEVRTSAADAIEQIASNPKTDAPALKNAISLLTIIVEQATNPKVLVSAAYALEKIASNPKTDAPDLINAASLLKIILGHEQFDATVLTPVANWFDSTTRRSELDAVDLNALAACLKKIVQEERTTLAGLTQTASAMGHLIARPAADAEVLATVVDQLGKILEKSRTNADPRRADLLSNVAYGYAMIFERSDTAEFIPTALAQLSNVINDERIDPAGVANVAFGIREFTRRPDTEANDLRMPIALLNKIVGDLPHDALGVSLAADAFWESARRLDAGDPDLSNIGMNLSKILGDKQPFDLARVNDLGRLSAQAGLREVARKHEAALRAERDSANHEKGRHDHPSASPGPPAKRARGGRDAATAPPPTIRKSERESKPPERLGYGTSR